MTKRQKRPPVQDAWKMFNEMWKDEQGKLQFNSRVVGMCELLWFLAPYILAAYWGASSQLPTQRKICKKRNRNM